MKINPMQITRFSFIGAACLIVVAGLDSERRAALADPWVGAPSTMKIHSEPRLPDVNRVIRRDPFSGVIVATLQSPNGSVVSASGLPPGDVPNPGQINVAPQNGPRPPVFGPNVMQVPNAGTITPNDGSSADISVIATMTGNGKPLALIANGTSTDIVGVGDVLGRRKITRIVSQGVEFADGGRLSVTSRSSVTSPGILPPNAGNLIPTSSNAGSGFLPGAQPQRQETVPIQTQQSQSNGNGLNGVPSSNPTQYNFGSLPTPAPGTTPAQINRLYTPPPSAPKTGP